MKKFNLLRLLCMVAGVGMVLASGPSKAQDVNLTVCGGSPSGLWSLLGAGLDAGLKKSAPTSTITYQTSSGGYANIKQVTQDKCDLGIIHVGEGVIANKGAKPFTSPVTGFRVLMVLYDWAPMQWIMSKEFSEEYGISSLADLAEKKPPLRLVLNRRGILPSQLGEASLNAVGVTFDDIESWGGKLEFQGSTNASEIMQNRRADMWANATFVGSSNIRKIADALPVTLLQVPGPVVETIVAEYGALPWTIEAGAYPWLEQDVHTHAARAVLIANESMEDELAYALAKTMIENADQMQAVHKAMKGFTPELMSSLKVLPYHPGAVKAFDEAGVR